MGFKPGIGGRQTSFSRQPLRYAIPPRVGQAGAILAPPPNSIAETEPSKASLGSVSFGNRVTGVQGTAFPILIRLATISFAQPVYILAVSLASSIVNASTTNVAMMVVHKDVGANFNIAQGYDYMAEHIVEQGLSHSIRTGISYNENIAPYFGTSDKMALYGLSLNAACAMTAIVTVRYLSNS